MQASEPIVHPPRKRVRRHSDSSVETFSRTITFESKLTEIDTEEGYKSEKFQAGGVPWYVELKKEPLHLDPSKIALQAYLCSLTSESRIWEIEATAKIVLLSSDPSWNNKNRVTGVLNESQRSWGLIICEWARVMYPPRGYIFDKSKLRLEVSINVTKTRGIRLEHVVNHLAADETHDVTLLIEGQRINANKAVLAIFSPVFKTMFSKNFKEGAMTEIPLPDVKAKEFLEMLSLIYPSDAKINESNVRSILQLADRFQIKKLTDEAEEFLLSMECSFSHADSLLLSDQYRLLKVQDICLRYYDTEADLTKLRETSEYEELSDQLKVHLFEKVYPIPNS